MPNFNAFMHRRNIFRKEPDIKRLACEYQELKQYVTVGSKNQLKFDFKNPDAFRAFTCVLLHRYFQKRITIPPDRMIPAVPQRLNYICWVEDLVKLLENQCTDQYVLGIDIGTGASCIFPILACHRNPTWSFIGVEADAKSSSIAADNVSKNFMEERVRIVKISVEDTLNDMLGLAPQQPVTFIMCNPPFFEDEYGVTLEMNPNVGGRPKSSANTSCKLESVISGGEVAFVTRLLEQSRQLKEEVIIYTSMLGRKQSLIHFKQTLSSMNEDNLSWTWAELCQGKTIRYAIAWSFRPGLDLTRAPPLRHGKNKSWKFKLLRKMPKRDCQLEMLENVLFLKNLIARELLIAKARVTRQTAESFEMLIKTNDRTWTNQRRKRREQLNKHKHQATPSSVNFNSCHITSNGSLAECIDTNDQKAHNSGKNNTDSTTQMICDNDPSTSKDALSSLLLQNRVSIPTKINAEHLSVTGGGLGGGPTCLQASKSSDNCVDMNVEEANASTTNLPNSGNTDVEFQTAVGQLASFINYSKKRKNPSSCSSSPSRVCPSPNDDLTDDDNQSTDNSNNFDHNDDSMGEAAEIKRICIKDTDDCDNMDDVYDYLLCCRISLTRSCRDLFFELKLEHPCAAASDAYDLFQYFRNKLTDK